MRSYGPLRRTILAGTTVLALAGTIAAPSSALAADGDGTATASGDLSAYSGVERLADDDTTTSVDDWTPEAMQAAVPMDAAPGADTLPEPSTQDASTPAADAPTGPVDQAEANTAEQPAPDTDGLTTMGNSWPTNGVPSVGALFFKIGPVKFRCTGTVINTASKNIVATAGHCIWNKVPLPNPVFVPGYHDGQSPYGRWSVKSRYIATQWRKNTHPDYDYGFLVLNNSGGRKVQDVTGANGWRTNAGYKNLVEITGYPGNRDKPLQCFAFTNQAKNYTWQLVFPCDNFANGVSGSLLLENYNSTSRLGTSIASLGGYQQGGNSDNTSYAVLWNGGTAALINAAVRGQ